MKDKKPKHLPKKLRSQFSKEIKSLFEGKIENINLCNINIPTVKIGCAWKEDLHANYIIFDQDLDNVYKKIYGTLEDLAIKKAKLFTNKIKKFNKNFDFICKQYGVDPAEEFDSIVDEFKIKSLFDVL